MPDINSTSRNQENGDIIVMIVAIIWMLYCTLFNIERYLPAICCHANFPLFCFFNTGLGRC